MHLTSSTARIFVAGHRGLAGSAIVRRLRRSGYSNLLLQGKEDLDLRSQRAVDQFFEVAQPEFVVLAAARVGGILANDRYPAEFITDNLSIQTNVLGAAHTYGVKRLLFLGSSCIYPKNAPQPLKEDYLLSGPLEPTNQWYAVAKIAGIKMCQAFRKQYGDDFVSVMPTNLFGPGDNFSLETSHVLPALLRKFHAARGDGLQDDAPIVVWGSGTPYREFLHSDELASACVFLLEQPEESLYDVAPDGLVNVGTGEDVTIRDLALLIRQIVGSTSELHFDRSKPDGTQRKRLDVSRMNALGWRASRSLQEGIAQTYAWYLEHVCEHADHVIHTEDTSFL